VITKFVTKFGDKFVTKFVTKLHWTPTSSSEESSDEEYDEEEEISEEEEYPAGFHMSDYDYMADVKGEYDELDVDKETFAEHLYDTDDYYK